MEIKILGTGCKKCNELEENAKKALESLKIEGDVIHVTDFIEIASYGVMNTPALVIDEKLISSGKVMKIDDIIAKIGGK